MSGMKPISSSVSASSRINCMVISRVTCEQEARSTNHIRSSQSVRKSGFILDEIAKATRRGHNDVTPSIIPFALLPVPGETTGKERDPEAIVMLRELDSFVGNLGGQLARRADDESANVGLRVLVDSALDERLAAIHCVLLDLLRVRIQCIEPSLNCRYQECQCFASASTRLDHEVARRRVLLVGIVRSHEVREKGEDGGLDYTHMD